jgi:hypothetical protein
VTVNIDERFGVTVHSPRKIATRSYVAEAVIFGRATQRLVWTVQGEGATVSAAKAACIRAARAWTASQ